MDPVKKILGNKKEYDMGDVPEKIYQQGVVASHEWLNKMNRK